MSNDDIFDQEIFKDFLDQPEPRPTLGPFPDSGGQASTQPPATKPGATSPPPPKTKTPPVSRGKHNDPYLEPGKPRVADYAGLHAAPATKISMLFFFFLTAAALFMGWRVRQEEYIVAKSGLGYYLGIAGGSMMLLLVLYPLRKKVRSMRHFGAIKYWFHIHMILGTLGPALILFHANFGIGSMNSTVALTATLLVAGSGFFQMFIYTKIHSSLFGRKMTLLELQEKTDANRSGLQQIFVYAPKLKKRLLNFENAVLTPPHSVTQSIIRILTIGIRTLWTHRVMRAGLRRGLKVTAKRAGWPAKELRRQRKISRRLIAKHMKTVISIVEFTFYERLFAQWYLFHVPLFYMLIIVATVHVVAVHMY